MAIGLWTIPSRPSHRAYNINNNKKKEPLYIIILKAIVY